ncbi:carbon storage regulator [Anaerobiospirillum thomasii]|uniref:Carbon storage regulator homolog n=1 Tax=Anaerobiospirillum thomasii TaxID=179995 RepID=A0A2X0V2S0_9GAMM|nr:carbon storage regulator [Anaerobiospirillum thomasii]SPT68839.1 Carbon storage regulator homolog [Anaerobiospirillum thomasii]
MLVISQKKGQKLRIGGDITVTIIDAKQGKVKLGIEAPASISVERITELLSEHEEKEFKNSIPRILVKS